VCLPNVLTLCIVVLNHVLKASCIRLVGVADTNIIRDQGRHEVAFGVLPKAVGMFTRDISQGSEVLLEAIVGELAGLRRPYMPLRASA
jgi:hypothetical protein